MIKEKVVSKDLANLLKDRGLDGTEIEVRSYYDEDGKVQFIDLLLGSGDMLEDRGEVLAPTYQSVLDLLRETYGIHCDFGFDDLGWFWQVQDLKVSPEESPKYLSPSYGGIGEYYEAVERSVKWVLENLLTQI